MQPLTDAEIRACHHPRLGLRFALALICALLTAPFLIIFSFFGVISLILFWVIFGLWLGAAIFFAWFANNTIMVSDLNYPRINTLCQETKTLLGVRKEFKVFVYQQGEFNAFMARRFRHRGIFLNSELLETGVNDDEVRWIVGRFIGYWRAQQDAGFAGWMIRVAEYTGFLTLFMLPHERAMVYTGDRLGLAAIGGDITSAISAMQKLLVGRQLGYSVNPVGVVEQRRKTKGTLLGFLSRVASGFPHTITRYVDLMAFAQRRYPEPYGRFESANPGLPADLNALSGERTSALSFVKGIGYYMGIGLATLITILVWVGLLVALQPRGGLPPASTFEPPPAPASEPPAETSPAPAPQAAPEAAPEAAPAPEAPAPQADGHAIAHPTFSAAPAPEDYARVYPQAARDAGVSGHAVLQCWVNDDGSLRDCTVSEESPQGYGFGDAALSLAPLVKLEPTSEGVPVGGGVTGLNFPFSLQ